MSQNSVTGRFATHSRTLGRASTLSTTNLREECLANKSIRAIALM